MPSSNNHILNCNYKLALLISLCLSHLVFLTACGDSDEERVNSFEVDATGDSNDKLKQDEFDQFVRDSSLNQVSSDQYAFSLTLANFFTDKYKNWILRKQTREQTTFIRYYCVYDEIIDNIPGDQPKTCRSLHPGLFDSTLSTFTWQPYIDNGDYEFWLLARTEDEELVNLKLQFKVQVHRITTFAVQSSWFDDTKSTSFAIPSAEASETSSTIVATAVFNNPNPEILTDNSQPLIDLSNGDEQIIRNYMSLLSYDQRELFSDDALTIPLTRENMIAALPRTRILISPSLIRFGVEISKTQFINLSTDEVSKSLQTSEKNLMDLNAVLALPLNPDLLKIYVETALTLRTGNDALGIAAPSDFPGISAFNYQWKLN